MWIFAESVSFHYAQASYTTGSIDINCNSTFHSHLDDRVTTSESGRAKSFLDGLMVSFMCCISIHFSFTYIFDAMGVHQVKA